MNNSNNPQDTTSIEQEFISILVAWRDHVEKLQKWNGKLPTDEAVAKLKALMVAADRQGELRGRSDEIVKITEWGKTIDDQWNSHFVARLASLQVRPDQEDK